MNLELTAHLKTIFCFNSLQVVLFGFLRMKQNEHLNPIFSFMSRFDRFVEVGSVFCSGCRKPNGFQTSFYLFSFLSCSWSSWMAAFCRRNSLTSSDMEDLVCSLSPAEVTKLQQSQTCAVADTL